MTFREDTIIFVVAKNDDGWFEGVIEPGIRGLFPVSDSGRVEDILNGG